MFARSFLLREREWRKRKNLLEQDMNLNCKFANSGVWMYAWKSKNNENVLWQKVCTASSETNNKSATCIDDIYFLLELT